MPDAPNLVLVHGAWADGSCWGAVIERLQADGVNVTAPQFPLTSLDDDVARLRHVLASRTAPRWWPATPTAARSSPPWAPDAPNVVGLGLRRRLRPRRGRVHRRAAGAGPADPGAGAPAHRRPGLRLAAAGRLRRPLRRRRRPGQGQRHARGPAAAAHERARRGDGRPGVEVAAVLVPRGRRTTRPSRPTPSACSRSAWARRPSRSPASHVAMVSHPDDVATLLKGALDAAAVAG